MKSPAEQLAERAKALALRPVEDHAPMAEFVLMRRAGVLFGFHVNEVESSGRLRELTAVPGAEDWLRGITMHRGSVLSVVDLLVFWGELKRGVADMPSFVCLSTGGRAIGLLVEELLGLDETDARLEPWQGTERPGLEAVTQRRGERVHVISAERLLLDPRLAG